MLKNYELYTNIKNESYKIFEVYHKKALASIFEGTLNMRDLNILRLIYKNKDIQIEELIQKLSIKYSNLSNRFVILEKSNFLIRSKDSNDSRKTVLALTTHGVKVVETFMLYNSNFVKAVRKEFSSMELLNFLNFIVRMNNEENLTGQKLTTLKLLNDFSQITLIIEKLQDFLINEELELLEENTLNLSYDDMSLLVEMHLNQVLYKKSLPNLAEDLHISYQTLVSKSKKLVQIGILTKEENHLGKYVFLPEAIHLIDNFINSRIIKYLIFMQHANPKEAKLSKRVFEYLKVYSIEVLKKTRDPLTIK